jgi:polysaccharide export outer membrane protein
MRGLSLFALAAYPLLGQPSPVLAPPESSAPYVLGPNDQIRIWVLGVEEIGDKAIRIDPGGELDLPLIGKLRAAGFTTTQFKAELIRQYSGELLKPQVSVEIVDYGSQPVSIMGAVNHPGIHQVKGRKTLMEVIAQADGLRPDAGSRVNISRQIQYGPIPLPTAKTDASGKFYLADVGVKDLLAGMHPAENILVYANDVITVPTAEGVFVIGEVKKPGEFSLKTDTVTVLQALANAEGFGPTPAPQNARIVRLVPGTWERKVIPVDLIKILAGRAEDIALRPNDILVVPVSGVKKFASRALEAAIQSAVGIVIWRHP